MAKQRMAGEVWKNYQIESFGANDLEKLRRDGLTNNDILKVAAASRRVEGDMDQRLRQLNNEPIDYKKIPKKVQGQLMRRGELGDKFVFMGGDPNDDKNYRSNGASSSMKAMNSPQVGGTRTNTVTAPKEWIANEATRDMPRGDRSEVFYWDGINADGTANALRGTRVESNTQGGKQVMRERDTTWRVSDDYLARRESAARPAAAKSQQQSYGGESGPPAPPLTERFDPSKYMLNTPSFSSASSSSSKEDDGQPKRYGYTLGNSGGIELGGYERFIKGLPSGLV